MAGGAPEHPERLRAAATQAGRRSPAPPNLALVALCLSVDALRRRRRSRSPQRPHSPLHTPLVIHWTGTRCVRPPRPGIQCSGQIPACVNHTSWILYLRNAAWSGASIEEMHLLSTGSLRHLLLTMPSAVGEKCVHVILLSLLVTHVFGQGKPLICHLEFYYFFCIPSSL